MKNIFDFQLSITDLKSKIAIGNLKSKGVEMAEAVQQKLRDTSPESRATSFEPEVLAFCCEH
jgi:hypothetical protein